jgi:putative ABC transport system permease protein
MTLSDTLHIAFRNLAQAKLRTSLTTLGVAIAIAALAGMVSLGVGLEEQIVGRIAQSGVFDAITITSAPAGRGGGRGGPFGMRGAGSGPAQSRGPRPDLDASALETIAAMEHVREAYPNVRIGVRIGLGDSTEAGLLSGVPMSARNEGSFQTMAAGAFFENDTVDACLLSLDMAKRLSSRDPKELIGQDLTVTYAAPNGSGTPGGFGVQQTDATFRIVGIVEREPGFGAAGLSGVMVPLPKALAIDAVAVRMPQTPFASVADALPKRTYSSATIRVNGAEHTQDVEDRVKAMGFTAISIADALQGAKRAFIVLDIVLSLIGSIALAVSSLGIVNTMVMSILERTREIGIMKAVGGSDGDIRRIFLIEASTIGVLGGITGVSLGWAVGRLINAGANIYIQSQGGAPGNLFSLPLWLIGGAIGFSWVVSIVAGSYPASRAARLNPIQALRHD